MRRRLLLTSLPALCLTRAAFAQTTPRRIRGTVRSLAGDTLTVETNAGDTVTVALAADLTVGALVPTTLDQIKPGSFIGIVGVGPKDHQRAVTITIFQA